MNTSPIWKTKRTLLYYRLWIQFSSRESMFAVCHNGTLNFFTFDSQGPNFNLWPLSPTNITNLKNFVPRLTQIFLQEDSYRSLPWSRQNVLQNIYAVHTFERFLKPYWSFQGGKEEQTTFTVRGLVCGLISNRLLVHHSSVESKLLFARLSDVRSYTEDRSPEIKLISHTWW